MKYYVTFGQTHVHKLNNIFDKDCVAELYSKDEDSAFNEANDLFGFRWSRLISEKELPKHLPYYQRGVITV